MHERMRRRYYCDFCKKSGGARYSIEKHERGCTANPNRTCGLHRIGYDEPPVPLTTLLEIVKGATDEDIDSRIPALREASGLWSEGCPACILAALRQAAPGIYSGFDFKAEFKAWQNEVNSYAGE